MVAYGASVRYGEKVLLRRTETETERQNYCGQNVENLLEFDLDI